MAHLNYIRGIDYQNSISLPQFLPEILRTIVFRLFAVHPGNAVKSDYSQWEDAVPAVALSCSIILLNLKTL